MRRADLQPPGQVTSLVAASWSAQVEQELAILPSSRRTRIARYGARILHPPGFERHPWAATFTNPEKGKPILGAGPCPNVSRTRSVADLIMVGRMADRLLRYRAFYLGPVTPLSVAVHEQPEAGTGTGLLAGAAVQQLVQGRLPVAVPRVVRTGTAQVRPGKRWWGRWPGSAAETRSHQVDVVVEEWLPGRPALVDDAWVVDELLSAIRALWTLEPVVNVSLSSAPLSRTRHRFDALVDAPAPDGLWPDDVDPDGLRRRVHSLLDRNPSVTVGLSHGDPGLGNALRTERGGVALIDWEDADRRPLSHDIFKILASSTAPPEHWGELHPVLPVTSPQQSSSAHEQLALAILQFLEGWQNRTRRAGRRKALPAHRRRMHRMIRAVDALLA